MLASPAPYERDGPPSVSAQLLESFGVWLRYPVTASSEAPLSLGQRHIYAPRPTHIGVRCHRYRTLSPAVVSAAGGGTPAAGAGTAITADGLAAGLAVLLPALNDCAVSKCLRSVGRVSVA